MYIRSLFCECRSYLAVIFKCLVTASDISLSTDDPSIVMCEDSGILLVSARICGDLAVLYIIFCESRVIENKTEFAVEVFINGIKCLDVCALILTDLRHNCEALWFDEDLSFLALLGAHFLAVCIVSTDEPVAVECRLHYVFLHLVDLSLSLSSFVSLADVLEDSNVSRTCVCEECCNESRLSYLGVTALCCELRIGVGLEGLTRCIREA